MEEPQDNRSLLLETAISLFASRGYDSVGVSELAESCSVTKPTLYHYFGSKRGLIEAILKDRFDPFLAAMREKADYSGNLSANLDECASFLFSRVSADPDFFRLMLASGFAPPESDIGEALKPWNGDYFGIFDSLFGRAAADHGNMRGRQTAYAAAFIGTVHAHASLMLAGYGAPDASKTRAIVHYFMHGIFS